MKNISAVLLVNLGTPKHYSVSAVRKYLREFLGDPRVMDINPVLRFFLVNFIIAPFRSFKSARMYRKIWTEKGSPLMVNSQMFHQKLQDGFGKDADVYLAMRYPKASLMDTLERISTQNYDQILLIPLFPQYASSTTGTILEKVYCHISRWIVIPEIKSLPPFYNTPAFIDSFTARLRDYDASDYDHVLFSFHSLPLHHLKKAHIGTNCNELGCTDNLTSQNRNCYQASCYHTARLIAEKSDFSTEDYSVGFQSRFARKWLGPYTDELIAILARKGIKKILVVCPSFVTDCLETTYEIGQESKELFIKNGGEKFTFVESLNDNDLWVGGLLALIRQL